MKNNTRKLTVIAVSAALSFLLQLIGSIIGLKVGGFLEIELSEIPALICTFAYGPIAGIVVEFIKNLIHCTITSTGFVGELANFSVNAVFAAVAGIIYKRNKTRKVALLSMLIAVLAMTASAILTNLFIMLPLYMASSPFSAKLSITLTLITPFNLIRGFVVSLITFFIYKRLSPLIKG